jgi:hypothetical protein
MDGRLGLPQRCIHRVKLVKKVSFLNELQGGHCRSKCQGKAAALPTAHMREYPASKNKLGKCLGGTKHVCIMYLNFV